MIEPDDLPPFEEAVRGFGWAAAELRRPGVLAALSLGEAVQAERLATAGLVQLTRLFGTGFVLERMRPRRRRRKTSPSVRERIEAAITDARARGAIP